MKLKPNFFVILVILILLFINLNSEFVATNITSDTGLKSGQGSEPLSNEGFFWSEIEIISEPIEGQNINFQTSQSASIAVEGNRIYTVWTDFTNFNNAGLNSDVFYRYFNGNIWSDIQVISEPIPGYDYYSSDGTEYPQIAVENGKIYVVWSSRNNTNGAGTDGDIFFRCNLTGTNWEDVQVISEPIVGQNFNVGNSYYPDITVENGKIYVIWGDYNNSNGAGNSDGDIFFKYNLTGFNWEDVQVISEPVFGKNINTGFSYPGDIKVENGNIYVGWSDDNDTNGAGTDYDTFFRCNISGLDWEPIEILSEPVSGKNFNTGYSSSPELAVENNKIYVIWNDDNNTNGASTNEDLFYRCNLTGTCWETVQVISEPILYGNNYLGDICGYSISIENENLYVVWSGENNTNNAGLDYDIFYCSNLSGSGWSPVEAISEPIKNVNTNIGDSLYPDMIVNNSKIYVVWSDENNTYGCGNDRDIFFKSKDLPLMLTNPCLNPNSGNTNQFFNYTIIYFHANNNAPANINVKINGNNYSMSEVDLTDVNYLNGKYYFYNITNLNIGIHTYQFWASDGINITSTAIFNNPEVYNTKPNILTEDNQTGIEDTYYEVIYNYEDIDRENVVQVGTWNFSTNASWLAFDNATATLNGTPTNDDVGSYWVNISINDTIDIDFSNFTLTVLNVNDDPMINTTNLETTYEDELYEVDYNASDVDSLISNQIWSFDTKASSWLDIDSNSGIISGTPTNEEVGKYWINVSVDDGDTGLDFSNFTLTVLNVNDPPMITTHDVLFTNESILYSVDYNATDVDSLISQQTWSLETNATWLSIDPSTGVLSGTPEFQDLFVDENIMVAGWHVNVSVTDGDGGSDSHEFILVVWKSQVIDNEPPVITTTDKVSITAGESYNNVYEATDDRTPLDSLIWSYNSNASWLSFNKITRTLSGNPTLSHVGWYWVNVTVNDGEGKFDSHNFTLTVWATTNEPPDILTEDDVNAVVDELYSVDYDAEDDRTPLDKLQWSLETNTSDWLDIDPETGVLSGTPKLDDVGSYWVEVSVEDGEDGWDFTNFTLHVTTEPITEFKPELSNPSITPITGDTNTEFTFSVEYSHPKGDLPDSIEVVIDGVGYDMEYTNGHYEYNTKLSEGVHTYYFTTTLRDLNVDTDTSNTGYITKAEEQPEDGDGDGDEDSTMLYAGIGIVVIIIIVVLILLFIFLKKKKEKEEEPPVEEAQPLSPEEVTPEVTPEQVPTPEAPTPDQPPEIPPEQVPAPEIPPPEQPPIPEVTPQVPQPQVEPAPEPAPMPKMEEQPVPQPQVEPEPQVETQEPAVEQPVEPLVQPEQPPVPRVKKTQV